MRGIFLPQSRHTSDSSIRIFAPKLKKGELLKIGLFCCSNADLLRTPEGDVVDGGDEALAAAAAADPLPSAVVDAAAAAGSAIVVLRLSFLRKKGLDKRFQAASFVHRIEDGEGDLGSC